MTIDGSSNGTISSPGYTKGEYIPNNADCTWTITVESGNVQLSITDFDLEDG